MLPIHLLMAYSGKAGTIYDLSSLASSYSDTGGATTTYGITFTARDSITDGTIDVLRTINSDLNNEELMLDPIGTSLWIKATYVSGQTFTSGDAVGSWLELSADKSWTMSYTSSGGADTVSGVYKFELATDSGGSNIVADSGNITFQVGETF